MMQKVAKGVDRLLNYVNFRCGWKQVELTCQHFLAVSYMISEPILLIKLVNFLNGLGGYKHAYIIQPISL